MEEVKEKVFQDLQQIQECFYDPYCNDEQIVTHHLHKVETLLERRGKQLDRLF